MIDIENAVYTQVRNAIKDVFSNVDISNEYTDNPASFPHVSFEMSDNAVHAPSMTANCREFAANQTFTANVYTTSAQRKSDAKAIADVIDGVMSGLGFRRYCSSDSQYGQKYLPLHHALHRDSIPWLRW